MKSGMLIGMEESARALEARKYGPAALLVRQAIRAHIQRYPEVAKHADAKPDEA